MSMLLYLCLLLCSVSSHRLTIKVRFSRYNTEYSIVLQQNPLKYFFLAEIHWSACYLRTRIVPTFGSTLAYLTFENREVEVKYYVKDPPDIF